MTLPYAECFRKIPVLMLGTFTGTHQKPQWTTLLLVLSLEFNFYLKIPVPNCSAWKNIVSLMHYTQFSCWVGLRVCASTLWFPKTWSHMWCWVQKLFNLWLSLWNKITTPYQLCWYMEEEQKIDFTCVKSSISSADEVCEKCSLMARRQAICNPTFL